MTDRELFDVIKLRYVYKYVNMCTPRSKIHGNVYLALFAGIFHFIKEKEPAPVIN